jgi:hypothetical protein
VDYIIPSVNLSDLQFFSIAGANSNCMYYIWHDTSLLNQANTTRFIDATDLVKYSNPDKVQVIFQDVLNEFGPNEPWNDNNETYENFHDFIGNLLLANDNEFANALGCPIDINNPNILPFTNSYNMSVAAFKVYLMLLNAYSTTTYNWFDSQYDNQINNETVLNNWFASGNSVATNITKRWHKYFANSNSHWAYTPYYSTIDHYDWKTEDGKNPSGQPWIVTLTSSTLRSLNADADNNGNIANEIYFYNASPFYTERGVIVFWTTFSLLLFAVSILIYLKTDIK